jgi:two-component system phosphate regulon sensor histidine kinase PhoR
LGLLQTTPGPKSLGPGLPLYGVMLVLPAVVLVGLHAFGLYRSYKTELGAIPQRAEAEAIRLARTLNERFLTFMDTEEQRPYYEYANHYSPVGVLTDELTLFESPMSAQPAPSPILSWFQADLDFDLGSQGETSPIRLFEADLLTQSAIGDSELKDLARAVRPLTRANASDFEPAFQSENLLTVPLATAAVHADGAQSWDCLAECFPVMRDLAITVSVTPFKIKIFRDESSNLRLAAVRQVRVLDSYESFPKTGHCMDPLRYHYGVAQGFFLDPLWLFEELPLEAAAIAIGPDTRLALGQDARVVRPENEEKLPLNLTALFEVDRAPGLTWPYTDAAIFVDRAAPASRFTGAILRFAAVALMLLLSLATGLVLLRRNVRQKLEQAAQTENFVAAVTHELRTPLASIKLHGEMLVDGIPQTQEARQEYYNRILGESERLSVLVENVLQKSSLDSERASSAPGDITSMVRLLEDQLATHGMHHHGFDPLSTERGGDLAFDLAEDLPLVSLHFEAINGILRNLVGNARKYAPVSAEQGAEPILVRTRLDKGLVLLEVADRGPGVPDAEQERIFEAFYRMGDESTRETPGTGLGLHLVVLHAQALGARVKYKARKGGGSIFVIQFKPA